MFLGMFKITAGVDRNGWRVLTTDGRRGNFKFLQHERRDYDDG